MNTSPKLFSRQEVRKMTGWSLVFIDKNLPRFKVGGKVFIELDPKFIPAEEKNPLFRGEGSPFALGMLFQMNEGSPYSFRSAEWDRFGRELVDAFQDHLKATDQYEIITNLECALAWSKTGEGQDFFDKHISSPGRQRRFAVYAK
ncbi:hypothetical protein ACLBWX_01100 [Methylobacterium sp. M6A4_1b]